MSEERQGPTVEQCLEELRQMFPDAHFISAKRQEYMDLSRAEPSISCSVQVDDIGSSPEPTFSATMAHIRKWKKSQS